MIVLALSIFYKISWQCLADISKDWEIWCQCYAVQIQTTFYYRIKLCEFAHKLFPKLCHHAILWICTQLITLTPIRHMKALVFLGFFCFELWHYIYIKDFHLFPEMMFYKLQMFSRCEINLTHNIYIMTTETTLFVTIIMKL